MLFCTESATAARATPDKFYSNVDMNALATSLLVSNRFDFGIMWLIPVIPKINSHKSCGHIC
jgi:hypothetical protein